jgi:hypothetical protein
MSANFQRIDKDSFVTETMMLLAKFGDYLATVESGLENTKRVGMNNVVAAFGQSGRLQSKGAKRLFAAHRKRFEKDMSRFCRYSAATTIYSLLEIRAKCFMGDFEKMYSGKPEFKKFLKDRSSNGFICAFRQWLETSPSPVILPQPRIWKQLDDFRLIRNCIVHDHGDRSFLKQPLLTNKVVERTRKVSFDSNGILILERDFVFEVCERITAFFGLLFQATGYSLALPPGYGEKLSKTFEEHKGEIRKKIAEYYAKQTINLGGQL